EENRTIASLPTSLPTTEKGFSRISAISFVFVSAIETHGIPGHPPPGGGGGGGDSRFGLRNTGVIPVKWDPISGNGTRSGQFEIYENKVVFCPWLAVIAWLNVSAPVQQSGSWLPRCSQLQGGMTHDKGRMDDCRC